MVFLCSRGHVSTIIEKVRSNAKKERSGQFNLFADFNGINFEEGKGDPAFAHAVFPAGKLKGTWGQVKQNSGYK